MKRLMLWRLYASRSDSSSTFKCWRRLAQSPVDQAEKALHAGSLMSRRRRWAPGKEMRPDCESFQGRHRGTTRGLERRPGAPDRRQRSLLAVRRWRGAVADADLGLELDLPVTVVGVVALAEQHLQSRRTDVERGTRDRGERDSCGRGELDVVESDDGCRRRNSHI